MSKAENNFWYAVATLVGTIVGVGIFGLPYAAWQSGFFIGALYLAALFFVFVLLHLMFGEIILRTKEKHRLVGYVKMYLGERSQKIITLTTTLGVLGGMLIYILIGGEFLKVVLGGAIEFNWHGYLIFWAVMSIILILGLKSVKWSEMIMLFFMGAVVLFLLIWGFSKIDANYFFYFHPNNLFIPYGITMFALAGTVAIPGMRIILKGSENKIKKAVIFGTAIPILFYFAFIFLVIGVSGPGVTQDAISGLAYSLGGPVVFLSALFGVFLVATSYLIFGLYLKDTLIYDLNVRRNIALLFIIIVPIFLTFARFGSFIEISQYL